MNLSSTITWSLLRQSIDEHEVRDISVDPNLGIGVGKVIYAAHMNDIITVVERAARYCSCHCNYCTCNCNYCTCNCDYCTCNCKHCTCNCNHTCVCDCAY